MLQRILVVLMVLASLSMPAYAVQPDEVLSDPALETRARALSLNMRCLVCQNQSIDDSDAPLAKDLRMLIRERLVQGDSDEEVTNYLVSRYGEFVLLKPRLTLNTLFLWAGPFILLLIGGIVVWRNRRVTVVGGPETGLDEEERKKLRQILRDGS